MSHNTYDRLHWAKRHAVRDEWFWTVLAEAGHKEPKADAPASLEIIRVAKRQLDLPNLVAVTKPIVDAFKQYGWLVDDTPVWLPQFSVGQRKCAKGEEPHMEVAVTYPARCPVR
jgi:hypothetical protein